MEIGELAPRNIYPELPEPFEVPPIFVCEAIAKAVIAGRMTQEEAEECVERYVSVFI